MAFVRAPTNSVSNTAPSAGQLYEYGKQTQHQFQCGWNCSYLGQSHPSSIDYTNFRQRLQPSSLVVQSMQAPPQPQQPQARYFMAGRVGCGFVKLAKEQHKLQHKQVVELNCQNPRNVPLDLQHPVCKINMEKGRGTPAYYEHVGGDEYKLVHLGFTKDLSFME